jgi:hypothetical protein
VAHDAGYNETLCHLVPPNTLDNDAGK